MTKTKGIKLVKFMRGVYFSEDREVSVMKDTILRADRDPWLIRWKDGLGCRKEKRCRTLPECREALKLI